MLLKIIIYIYIYIYTMPIKIFLINNSNKKKEKSFVIFITFINTHRVSVKSIQEKFL